MSSLMKGAGITTATMLLGLVVGSVFFTFNIVGFNLAYFPGDLGDGRLNLYFLEHVHLYFTGKIESFWDAPFMYPEKNVLAYSDNLSGSAPFYSFFRLIGFDTFLSYQLWFIVVSSLNYITAFYFLKYVTKNNYAAVLGAFVFAFSLALQSQLAHAQTFPRFAIPLTFLMAVKFSESLKPKYLFLTLLFLVYQIYCGIYSGFMLAIPTGIFLAVVILRAALYKKETVFNVRWILQIIGFTLINVIMLLPLMLPYMQRRLSPGLGHYEMIRDTLPTIKSYFFSRQGSLLWDYLSSVAVKYPAFWDHQIFAGAIATTGFMVGVVWLLMHLYKTRLRLDSLSTPLLLILTGLITFLLYMRFSSISAYIGIYFLPGFSSMRSLTRIINIQLLFFGLATALVFSKLFTQYFKYQHLFFLVALVLIVFDNYYYSEKSTRTIAASAMERTILLEKVFAGIPAGSIVSYEPAELQTASIYYNIDAMLASQKFGLKVVNGYTATCPGDFGPFWDNPGESTRNYWLAGKSMGQDSLYVVKGINNVEIVSVADIHNQYLTIKEEKIKNMIEYIWTDENWMNNIRESASLNNVPLDSMVRLNAIYVIELNENK